MHRTKLHLLSLQFLLVMIVVRAAAADNIGMLASKLIDACLVELSGTDLVLEENVQLTV